MSERQRVCKLLLAVGIALGSVFGLSALQLVASAAGTAQSPVQLLESTTSHVVVELSVPAYAEQSETAAGQKYTALLIEGFGRIDQPGKPQLPMLGALIGIPADADVALHILVDESNLGRLEVPVLPAPTGLVEHGTADALPRWAGMTVQPDAAIYAGNSAFPAAPVEIASVGTLRSQRYAQLRFMPLQVRPASGTLVFHRRLRVELSFSYPNGKAPEGIGAPTPDPYLDSTLRESMLNFDSARNWRMSRAVASAATGPASRPASAGTWYKIALNSDGMYAIRCPELAAAGLAFGTYPTNTLKVYKQGSELAIVQSGAWSACTSDDYLLFYGEAAQTRYTDTNIFWLTSGGVAGRRAALADGSVAGSVATTFVDTAHFERNVFYISNVDIPEGSDHWFWTSFPNATTQSLDFGFHLDNRASVAPSATVVVKLKGGNSASHHTLAYLNDNLVDDTVWAGTQLHTLTMTVPQSMLNPITNTLRFSESAPYPASYVFFDNFDVTYARTMTPTNDELHIRPAAGGPWQYQVGAFVSATVRIFDVTDRYSLTQIVSATLTNVGGGTAVQFADALAGPREYVVLSDARLKSPLSITADAPSSLADPSNGADYIIIAYGGFITNVLPLKALRESQGMRVKVVDVQDVYDEFSDGLMDAQAIHDFLAYAYAHWQVPAPAYVLLVGDGNWDFKHYNSSSLPNFIPPYLKNVDPWLGETASDSRLVAFNLSNTVPSMAIGRLPADSVSDVDAMVNKIVGYELNPPPGNWHSTTLFVTDNAYQSDGTPDITNFGGTNFWTTSDKIASDAHYVPPPLQAERIYFNPCVDIVTYPQCALPYTPAYTTAAQVKAGIIDAINQGRVLVNYIGHADPIEWAGTPVLFKSSDLSQLNNGSMLPMILAMTCFDGFFQQPAGASLAESMIRKPNAGSIANWSATGEGLVGGHDFLDRGFFDAVVNAREYHIGLAADAGKLNLWLNSVGNYDLIDTFMIFGDPATKLSIMPSGLYLPLITR